MTKGLHVCRQLRRAGWRVVAVDYDKWWMGMSRFSTSVAAFHTVPDPGRDSLGRHCSAGLTERACRDAHLAVHCTPCCFWRVRCTRDALPHCQGTQDTSMAEPDLLGHCLVGCFSIAEQVLLSWLGQHDSGCLLLGCGGACGHCTA